MEVLANGMKANFWIGVEEEPDIDRFVDEQIMIDMDRFMLVCTLEKVSTCKKKNEEKEFEYFKQITVMVNNICLASDNNFNIQIPAKKEEFLYTVKFRYAPEPAQDEEVSDVKQDARDAADEHNKMAEELDHRSADDKAIDGPVYEGIESPSAAEMIEANDEPSELEQVEGDAEALGVDPLIDDMAKLGAETAQEMLNDTEETEGKTLVEVLTEDDFGDDEFEESAFADMAEDEAVFVEEALSGEEAAAIPPETKPETIEANLDEFDDIDWGDN